MTLRSGRRPRDSRASQARPYDPDAYATESIPEYSEPPRRDRGRGGQGRNGLVGLLKFLAFALVLAAIVVAVALSALRPVVDGFVISVARDNPAVLQVPFVRDLVRQNLGIALTTPASSDGSQVEFLIQPGDTARTIASRLEHEGLIGEKKPHGSKST